MSEEDEGQKVAGLWCSLLSLFNLASAFLFTSCSMIGLHSINTSLGTFPTQSSHCTKWEILVITFRPLTPGRRTCYSSFMMSGGTLESRVQCFSYSLVLSSNTAISKAQELSRLSFDVFILNQFYVCVFLRYVKAKLLNKLCCCTKGKNVVTLQKDSTSALVLKKIVLVFKRVWKEVTKLEILPTSGTEELLSGAQQWWHTAVLMEWSETERFPLVIVLDIFVTLILPDVGSWKSSSL